MITKSFSFILNLRETTMLALNQHRLRKQKIKANCQQTLKSNILKGDLKIKGESLILLIWSMNMLLLVLVHLLPLLVVSLFISFGKGLRSFSLIDLYTQINKLLHISHIFLKLSYFEKYLLFHMSLLIFTIGSFCNFEYR